jgi:hypothetical protein
MSHGKICNQCSHSWDVVKVVVPKIERNFEHTGYTLPPEPPPIWGNPLARSKK